MSERCAIPVKAAGHATICMRPIDHDGECRPLRSDVIQAIEYHDKQADELTAWITEHDANYELWPKEGPSA